MKKQQTTHHTLRDLLIVFGICLLVLVAIVILYNQRSEKIASRNQESSLQASNTTTYSSKSLKLSIDVPKDLQVEEKITTIIFKNDRGNIILGRSATNFDNISDYLKDLNTKNGATLLSEESIDINGLQAVKGFINKDMFYYIYADYWVYSVYTSSESLFDELDQIAQSFRYTP